MSTTSTKSNTNNGPTRKRPTAGKRSTKKRPAPQAGNSGAVKGSLLYAVESLFKKNYPALLPSLKVSLAVCVGMVFKDKSKPVSLILENPSGRGKSTVVETFFPVYKQMNDYVYRSDMFTPKAFVTNAANMDEAKRQKIDLLPQLENKYFLTKELAPIFRGDKKDLAEMFKILIAVLDGEGHKTNTGLASRGYGRPIVFNWLGATTPLSRSTFKLMSQLGTRLLFYETPVVEIKEDDLIAYAARDDISNVAKRCRQEVNRFVITFFTKHPPRTLPCNSVTISRAHIERIVKLADFLARTRAEVSYERIDNNYIPTGVSVPEGPYKLINYFKEIARSLALIHERDRVDESDIEQIRHIAISSTPSHIRPMLWELAAKGEVDTKRATELCQVSDTTINDRYSEELRLLGLIEDGSWQKGVTRVYKLHQSYAWLRP